MNKTHGRNAGSRRCCLRSRSHRHTCNMLEHIDDHSDTSCNEAYTSALFTTHGLTQSIDQPIIK